MTKLAAITLSLLVYLFVARQARKEAKPDANDYYLAKNTVEANRFAGLSFETLDSAALFVATAVAELGRAHGASA